MVGAWGWWSRCCCRVAVRSWSFPAEVQPVGARWNPLTCLGRAGMVESEPPSAGRWVRGVGVESQERRSDRRVARCLGRAVKSRNLYCSYSNCCHMELVLLSPWFFSTESLLPGVHQNKPWWTLLPPAQAGRGEQSDGTLLFQSHKSQMRTLLRRIYDLASSAEGLQHQTYHFQENQHEERRVSWGGSL